MSKLIVYYETKVVGHLIFDKEERLSFLYDSSWLSSESRFPLSLALALDDKVHGHLETKSFFENLLPEGEYPLFMTERFDRFKKKSLVGRVHQQDFCQAQGITSLKKYESDGGPTFKDNYNLVKNNSVAPIPDLNQLIKWLIFNLVIGNNDSHSKNLAFLQTEEGIRLAPFYDLLSTSIYKEIGQNFSFKIGGQNLCFKMKRRLFDKLSSELGLKEDVIPKHALKLLSDIDKKLPQLVQDFNDRFTDVKIAGTLEKEIKKRKEFFKKTVTI